MTQLLGKFTKQSGETLDYDVDFSDWFSNRSDTAASYTATADTGITITTTVRTGNIVKVVLSDGIDGVTYKVTVRLTTTSNLIKEADFTVRIKDI